jgi:hypothetical protein
MNTTIDVNDGAGLSFRAFVAPVDFFEKIAEPVSIDGSPASKVVILDNHEFKTGMLGFIEIWAVQETVAFNANTNGEMVSLNLNNIMRFFIPGIHEDGLGTLSWLLNKPCVVLLKEMNGSNKKYQIGTNDLAAYIREVQGSSGFTKDGRKGIEVNFGNYTPMPLIYKGRIQPYLDMPKSPIFLHISEDEMKPQDGIDSFKELFITKASLYAHDIVDAIKNDLFDRQILVSYANDLGGYFNALLPTTGINNNADLIAALQQITDHLQKNIVFSKVGEYIIANETNMDEYYLGLQLVSKEFTIEGGNNAYYYYYNNSYTEVDFLNITLEVDYSLFPNLNPPAIIVTDFHLPLLAPVVSCNKIFLAGIPTTISFLFLANSGATIVPDNNNCNVLEQMEDGSFNDITNEFSNTGNNGPLFEKTYYGIENPLLRKLIIQLK